MSMTPSQLVRNKKFYHKDNFPLIILNMEVHLYCSNSWHILSASLSKIHGSFHLSIDLDDFCPVFIHLLILIRAQSFLFKFFRIRFGQTVRSFE